MTTKYLDASVGKNGRSRYDAVVEGWSRLKPYQRQERAKTCRTKGHDWEALSWGTHVCVCCLTYRDDE